MRIANSASLPSLLGFVGIYSALSSEGWLARYVQGPEESCMLSSGEASKETDGLSSLVAM